MPNIQVPADQFDSVSDSDKERIIDILRKSKLIGPEDQIIGDPDATGMGTEDILELNPCKILCDLGEALAVAECNKLNEPAKSVCVAAARAGAEVCRSNC